MFRKCIVACINWIVRYFLEFDSLFDLFLPLVISNRFKHCQDLVISLLEAINDKNTEVQESVCESLVALGRKRAEFIFKASFEFVIKNQAKVSWIFQYFIRHNFQFFCCDINYLFYLFFTFKLSDPHKSLIFNTIEKIVKEDISKLDEILAQNWIEVATNEMIQMRVNKNILIQNKKK